MRSSGVGRLGLGRRAENGPPRLVGLPLPGRFSSEVFETFFWVDGEPQERLGRVSLFSSFLKRFEKEAEGAERSLNGQTRAIPSPTAKPQFFVRLHNGLNWPGKEVLHLEVRHGAKQILQIVLIFRGKAGDTLECTSLAASLGDGPSRNMTPLPL